MPRYLRHMSPSAKHPSPLRMTLADLYSGHGNRPYSRFKTRPKNLLSTQRRSQINLRHKRTHSAFWMGCGFGRWACLLHLFVVDLLRCRDINANAQEIPGFNLLTPAIPPHPAQAIQIPIAITYTGATYSLFRGDPAFLCRCGYHCHTDHYHPFIYIATEKNTIHIRFSIAKVTRIRPILSGILYI